MVVNPNKVLANKSGGFLVTSFKSCGSLTDIAAHSKPETAGQ